MLDHLKVSDENSPVNRGLVNPSVVSAISNTDVETTSRTSDPNH
jgi:hypothetical protein